MKLFTKPKRTSATLSLPETRKVRGYIIRRMPIGKYLEAMNTLQDMPEQLLRALFPDMGLMELLANLKTMDADGLQQLVGRALAVAPEYIVKLIASLAGIDPLDMLEDERIGLSGLMEIVTAWLEVNEIENFMHAARSLWGKAKKVAAAKTGSRG